MLIFLSRMPLVVRSSTARPFLSIMNSKLMGFGPKRISLNIQSTTILSLKAIRRLQWSFNTRAGMLQPALASSILDLHAKRELPTLWSILIVPSSWRCWFEWRKCLNSSRNTTLRGWRSNFADYHCCKDHRRQIMMMRLGKRLEIWLLQSRGCFALWLLKMEAGSKLVNSGKVDWTK